MSREVAASNPFVSRNIRPGAIGYLFPPGADLPQLVHRLQHNGWTGEIVGPHGSGKSTLLVSIREELARRGKPVLPIVLRAGQSALPREALTVRPTSDHVVAVDGYEQLSRWSNFRLRRLCRRCGCGLLVTSHQPTGLPELLLTRRLLEVAQEVARRLQRDVPRLVSDADVAEQFSLRKGDVRETMFGLYDLYELRLRQQARR